MQDTVLDLLRAALIPELRADVAAGAAGNVQLVLVAVAALGALPDQLAVVLDDLDLAVVAAALAVVGFGVQFGVHDVVIDELKHAHDCFQIVLHVGHFHVADGAARRQLLEIALELQLGESVDRLRHMDMIAVGDIVFVGDARDKAEPLLQTLGELVGRGLQRRAVERVVDVLGLLPLVTLVVHVLHDAQCKGLCTGIGVAAAGHIFHALIQAGVAEADGGIAAVKQLVDLLALLQAGQRAVLPQNGGRIAGRAQQTLMACLKRTVAESQTVVENFPELIKVAAGGQGYIHQIDGDDALIEAAIVFGLARLGVHIRGQEAAAAHAGIAMALAVLIDLHLQHLLLGDVVGDHPLGGALGGQLGQIIIRSAGTDVVLFQNINELREGGGDPDTGFVLDALIPLTDGLLDDDGEVGLFLRVAGFAQIHKDGDERSLTVGGHQGDDLILDGLNAAVDLVAQTALDDLLLPLGGDIQTFHLSFNFVSDLLAGDVHEGSQMGQADALAAVLVGSDLCDDLSRNVAGGGEAVRLLDISAGNDRAVLKHVFQIDQIAVVHVLGEVVRIVEVDQTLLMSFHDFRVQQQTGRQVLGDLTGHIVALDAIDGGVLVGVLLLDFLVLALDQAEDALIRGIRLALEALHIPIGDVVAGEIVGLHVHQLILDHVLNLFHADRAVERLALVGDVVGDLGDLLAGQAAFSADRVAGLGDSSNDLGNIKRDF